MTDRTNTDTNTAHLSDTPDTLSPATASPLYDVRQPSWPEVEQAIQRAHALRADALRHAFGWPGRRLRTATEQRAASADLGARISPAKG